MMFEQALNVYWFRGTAAWSGATVILVTVTLRIEPFGWDHPPLGRLRPARIHEDFIVGQRSLVCQAGLRPRRGDLRDALELLPEIDLLLQI